LEKIRTQKKPPVGKPSAIPVNSDFKKVEDLFFKETPMKKFTTKKFDLNE